MYLHVCRCKDREPPPRTHITRPPKLEKNMNEYKIQLESREDLMYLRDEMNKFFNENYEEKSEKNTETFKQQVKKNNSPISLPFYYSFLALY